VGKAEDMSQQLLEELESLREAHRTAKTQDDFDALLSRMQAIETLFASTAERSRGANEALKRVKALVSEAIRSKGEGLDQPTNFSATVFAMMQAVRRGTTGYDG
jgi:hypothetical protein